MRTPEAAFDLRAALVGEVRGAMSEFEDAPGDGKALHRCRVRLKRARALARVGAVGAPGLASVFNDMARSLMRMLPHARGLDALIEQARRNAKTQKKKTALALEAAAQALQQARVAAGGLDQPRIGAALRDLLAMAQVWPEASARQIARGAVRVERKARRARRRAQGAVGEEVRHDWRKREKDRHYGGEILGAAWPSRRRRKRTAKLVELLGRERDVHLLIQRLESDAPAKGAKRALKALKRRRRNLRMRADAQGAKLRP